MQFIITLLSGRRRLRARPRSFPADICLVRHTPAIWLRCLAESPIRKGKPAKLASGTVFAEVGLVLVSPENQKPIRVVSYNIQGQAARKRPGHLARIAETIVSLNPDIVGLQEVHRKTSRSRGEDQAETLERLTGMKMFFGRSCTNWGGEYGNAVLTRREVISSTVHCLPGAGEPRSVAEAVVRVGDLEVAVLVAHLAAWGWFRRKTRVEQMDVVAGLTKNRTGPYILVGDFNAPPGAREICEFVANSHLRVCDSHDQPTYATLRQRLDYVFSDPGWETVHAEVVRTGPSDHWPLLVELARLEVRSVSSSPSDFEE